MRFIVVLSGPSVAIVQPHLFSPRSRNAASKNDVKAVFSGPLLRRLEKGLALWKQLHGDENADNNDLFVIVTGADGDGSRPFTSASLMAQYYREHGVPSHKIIEEPLANNTIENAIRTLRIIKQCEKDNGMMRIVPEDVYQTSDTSLVTHKAFGPVKEIHVVTSNFHLYRTSCIFTYYAEKVSLPIIMFIGSEDNLTRQEADKHREIEQFALTNLDKNIQRYEELFG